MMPMAGSQVVAGEAVVVLGGSDLAPLELKDLELEGATV